MNQDINEITDEYDREFISLMIAIEKKSEILNKYDKLRVKSWCKKLCQVTNNIEWKKNRNLHAICILDSVLNEHFEEPYNKFPPEGTVPILNKTLVKSKLTKKFFEETMNMQKEEEEQNNQQINEVNENNYDNKDEENPGTNNNENNNKLAELVEYQQTEINQLKEELNKKDNEISKLQQENEEMKGKIQELEKMLSSFMNMEKNE